MAIEIDTIGKASVHNLLVLVECKKCGKQARFHSTDLAGVYGHSRDPRTLPFRCEKCDTYDCKIMMEFPDFDRVREMVIWKPMKVKGPL
ncbi:hypothetical protein CN074_24975 [Sinorhizobium medicae]|uniref:hypothetical protein n=1 Tax=Sinorhizobium medicae TaxID=110321 RepID=UPI000FD9A931|nr:hypothetical protein [Sinorhizobium medicae]RVH84257.1 hypothetical protein CN201_26820 [Sinorhizobium medicae]RVP63851.1 hypothetical protein CN074_24975 [Sinorhizobium medicae]